MTDYLVEQLRMDWDTDQSILSQVTSWHNQRRIAADRIEALTVERDRLRVALEDIADHDTGATAGLAYTAKIALKGETP